MRYRPEQDLFPLTVRGTPCKRFPVAAQIQRYLGCFFVGASLLTKPFVARGQAAPATAPAKDEIAKLKAQRDNLQKQMQSEFDAAINSNPLMKSAHDLQYQDYDAHKSADAARWVMAHSRTNPSIIDGYESLYSLLTLLTLANIMKEENGIAFVKPAIVGPSNLDQAKIAKELQLDFPDLSKTDLSDKERLWNAMQDVLPAKTKVLEDRVDDLRKRFGFPEDVVDGYREKNNASVRADIYENYVEDNYPDSFRSVRRSMAEVVKKLNSLDPPSPKD